LIDRVSNQQILDNLNREELVVDKVKLVNLQLFEHICRMKDNRRIKTVRLGRAEMCEKNRKTR
jgi:hypothetical protein